MVEALAAFDFRISQQQSVSEFLEMLDQWAKEAKVELVKVQHILVYIS